LHKAAKSVLHKATKCFANENLEVFQGIMKKLLHKAAKNVLHKTAKNILAPLRPAAHPSKEDGVRLCHAAHPAQFSKIKKGGFHRLLEIFIFKYFLCFGLFHLEHLLCEGLIG